MPIGFAAAIASNYRLEVRVLPWSYLLDAEVRLTGSLSDRGWPAVDGHIQVTATAPSDTAYCFPL